MLTATTRYKPVTQGSKTRRDRPGVFDGMSTTSAPIEVRANEYKRRERQSPNHNTSDGPRREGRTAGARLKSIVNV